MIENNNLFIVCPFSCLENFLKERYGNDIFFLTFSAAVLQYNEFEYLCRVKDFTTREKIKSIYFVNDTSCRFINGIINQGHLSGLISENSIVDLYVEHYFSEFKDKPLFQQQFKMAELNIQTQLNEMMNSSLFGSYIKESAIELKGLITSKEINASTEIKLNFNNLNCR